MPNLWKDRKDTEMLFMCQIKHHKISIYGTVDTWLNSFLNSTLTKDER